VAAANVDLAEEVTHQRFRQDLFYRLNVIHVCVPPLRERRDDILFLARHFLAANEHNVVKKIRDFSESVQSFILDYGWPGNVRELENAVERAIVVAKGDVIAMEDLPPAIVNTRDDHTALEQGMQRQFSLAELERYYIDRIMLQTRGNKNRAAQILGIDRKTLARKLGRENTQPD